jgi:hypothetical protein
MLDGGGIDQAVCWIPREGGRKRDGGPGDRRGHADRSKLGRQAPLTVRSKLQESKAQWQYFSNELRQRPLRQLLAPEAGAQHAGVGLLALPALA